MTSQDDDSRSTIMGELPAGTLWRSVAKSDDRLDQRTLVDFSDLRNVRRVIVSTKDAESPKTISISFDPAKEEQRQIFRRANRIYGR